jgi:DNA ligase-1
MPKEVEKFQCMLAASAIPTESQLKGKFPMYASFKLDGIRSPMTGGTAMSRKMLPLPNKHIQKWSRVYQTWLQGLDGEMIVGPSNLSTTFNTSTSGIMSEDGEPDFKFYVFEFWDLGEATAKERYEFLLSYLPTLPAEVQDKIVLLDQKLIHNMEELKAYYEDSLAFGYEGLILKVPNKPYKRGRSTINEGIALKWKEFIDYNCIVIEVKQGKTNTNEKVRDELGHAKRSTAKAGKVPIDEVGGFLVECVEKESVYYGMQFSCGPGALTQNELKRLWTIRYSLVGRTLRVKSQKLGGKSLPRFPSWYGWVDSMNTGEMS